MNGCDNLYRGAPGITRGAHRERDGVQSVSREMIDQEDTDVLLGHHHLLREFERDTEGALMTNSLARSSATDGDRRRAELKKRLLLPFSPQGMKEGSPCNDSLDRCCYARCPRHLRCWARARTVDRPAKPGDDPLERVLCDSHYTLFYRLWSDTFAEAIRGTPLESKRIVCLRATKTLRVLAASSDLMFCLIGLDFPGSGEKITTHWKFVTRDPKFDNTLWLQSDQYSIWSAEIFNRSDSYTALNYELSVDSLFVDYPLSSVCA
jgi:hypothetical protein